MGLFENPRADLEDDFANPRRMIQRSFVDLTAFLVLRALDLA